MKISEKYRHVGYSYPGVPKGWVRIVEDTIVEIERAMWPRWIPLFVKRWIHYMATGNSVVRVKSRFWYKVRTKLTKNMIITDIKDKYATLRIYGYFNKEVGDIISKASKKCSETCETCSSIYGVRAVDYGWVYNLCKDCRSKKKVTKKKN
jgi:hypothetical protein